MTTALYMARCDAATLRVSVYHLDSTGVHLPDHNKERAKTYAKEPRSWVSGHPGAPGFASVGRSEVLALECLHRLVQQHYTDHKTPGLHRVIRSIQQQIDRRTAHASG